MQKFTSERGLSLVEATIILMVLAILTSVLTPSMGDYINEARHTKVKEDVEELGMGIMRLLRDIGKPFLQRTAGSNFEHENRVDLLVSEGNTPSKTSGTGVAASTTGYLIENAVEWDDPIGDEVEHASDHLVDNDNGYTAPSFPALGGPKAGLGWRGAYISNSTGPDPWGNRYGCNTVFLNPGSDVTSSTHKGTNHDVFCLSAGADGNVDTDMESTNSAAVVGGDDILYVFQGSTR